MFGTNEREIAGHSVLSLCSLSDDEKGKEELIRPSRLNDLGCARQALTVAER